MGKGARRHDLSTGQSAGQMRLLIVAHALLWWLTDDAKLSARARQRLGDEGNQVLVSAASA